MTKPVLWLLIASLFSLTTSTAASTGSPFENFGEPRLSEGFSLIPSKEIQARPESAPLYTAYDLIAEVNALRASNGLPAYSIDPILMQIAQAHSDYQASIGTTTHYGADGSRPFQRALAAGFPLAGDLSRGGFMSENITAGSRTPAQAVQGWQADAPHLDTMLSPNLTHVGAGVTISGGTTYYTLDAAASIGSVPNYTPPATSSTSIAGTPGTPGTLEIVKPVITSTPKDDGSVYHEVQAGEALWSIALAYNTTVDEIKQVNRLATNDIFEGQMLLIRNDEPPTATPDAPTATVTIGVPFSTATRYSTATQTSTSTPQPAPPTSPESGGLVVGAIAVGALLAAGLGTWISKKKPLE